MVCGDGTGWREAGQAGYVWTFGTPTLRHDHHDRSRAGKVGQQVLRDSHDLRAAHPGDADLAAWADAVHAVSLAAKQLAASELARDERVAARAALERRLSARGAPSWAPASAAPQATRCRRVDRFLDELFAFVLDPAVPADNTLAERSRRPLVVARKVSGGTRSPEGSRGRMALAALCGTWLAQGRDPIAACHQLLLAPAL